MNNSLKTVVIIGGTGLIGHRLVSLLKGSGYVIKVLTRDVLNAEHKFNNEVDIAYWDGISPDVLVKYLNGTNAVVNLSGSSIAVRWTKKAKEKIYQSRIGTTNAIVRAIKACDKPPSTLIQASAIGYYSYNSDVELNEDSPKGEGFLADLVLEWENSAKEINTQCRLVLIRTGVVLASNGEFIKRIVLPIKLFLGGWIGNGSQILPWIHIDDHVRAVKFLIENEECNGSFNLVSPSTTSYKQFVKALGKIMDRPIWLPIPKFFLKIIFGRMATETICSNQNIVPDRLLKARFDFAYNDLSTALANLFIRNSE